MPITVFVDTNVFLSLYAFSDDDIQQFRNLFILSQEGEIDFLLPQQVIDEFWRNRETKIAEGKAQFQTKLSLKIPAPVRDMDEAVGLIEAQRILEERRKALLMEFLRRVASNELSADKLIIEIFEKSTVISVTDEIVRKAERRVLLGNPPGKTGGYGDAINWECVLSKLEFLDDLCFISRDNDYSSKLEPSSFNEFLRRELASQLSEVDYFSSLRAFMEEKFPSIEFEAFTEASEAVQAIEGSTSFASTHAAISRLENCDSFSTNQIKRLIVAAEENDQVHMILDDGDLRSFFGTIQQRYNAELRGGWNVRLTALVVSEETEMSPPPDFDEVPF